jgi:hypothetical protein
MKTTIYFIYLIVLVLPLHTFSQSPFQATIAGKYKGTVSAKEILEAKKITIGDNPCYLVTSYKCTIYSKDREPIVIESNYDMITSELKEVLPTLPSGTKIYFEFIKAKDVNGPLQLVSPIAFTIK